jgi:glycosyltransferase involved in cell wall biosynthesis
MASGTPLVASRTGALPEVTGDAAVLVEPGDPEELAAALRDLLDSPERRASLAQAAWHRVQERFTWSAVARAVVAEYRRAIAMGRGGGAGASRARGGGVRTSRAHTAEGS